MITPVRNASIRTKLVLLAGATVSMALIMSSTGIVLNDVKLIRRATVEQLELQARMLEFYSDVVMELAQQEAAENLLQSMSLQPAVELACLLDTENNLFAAYRKSADTSLALPTTFETGARTTDDGYIEIVMPVRQDDDPDESLGTLYIRANTDNIAAHTASQVTYIILASLGSLLAAVTIAAFLQRAISGPVVRLTAAAQAITREEDYSIRVKWQSDDELGVLSKSFNQMVESVQTSKQALLRAHDELEMRVAERTHQLSEANEGLNNEVLERRRAEQKLEEAHQELLASARRAGMAEIATGVLHNVGNVLNSVNVSAQTVNDQLRGSKRSQLDRLVALIDSHRDDLGDFVSRDEKGKQIPAFLNLLTQQLRAEDDALLEETRSLMENVEHIKTIVSTQQSYAGISGVIQPTDLRDLLNDAVRLNSSSFERHGIAVVRDYDDLPPVLIDKQRVLQIVINLVKNAKEALLEQAQRERTLTLRTRQQDGRLLVEVQDTGSGIKPQNLTRIFSHGFTTKKSGHGFGLHSCANAATEMNGSLSVRSDGEMTGAIFTLSLPFTPAAAAV
jgi:two-component system NtrC family sensor kinase